jgi:hypothetical protein
MIYCVYTPQDPQSRVGLERCIQSANMQGEKVTPYKAVWWKDIDTELKRLGIFSKYKPVKKRLTNFEKRTAPAPRIANGITHFKLYQKCVELGKPITILEHDSYFVKPLPTNLPDNMDDAVIQISSHLPYQTNYKHWDGCGRFIKMMEYGETHKKYRDWRQERGMIPHPLSGTNGTSGYMIGYIKSEGVAFADRVREDHIGGPDNLYLQVPQCVECAQDIQSTRLTGYNYDNITRPL